MSPANPLSRLSAIIRGPISTHSSGSDWFLPYDGPVEPPPAPPIRHPFAAAEIAQPRPIKVQPESRSRANSKSDDVRGRSRSRSVDTKRKSQRSFATLEKGGVGAYPDSEREYDQGHVRGKSSITRDPKQSFPWSDDSLSTGDTPALVFANHPFRMHTTSPPPRTHTASTPLTTTTTPWVRTITASPAPPDPAPMRKRTMTYQPGLVTTFGSSTESRVGYRESGAFVDLDERERERIRPTLLPSSLSLLAKGASDLTLHDELGRKKSPAKDRELYPGLKQTYDLRSHPYALQSAPMRETRFGSASTTGTTTTGGSGSVKPSVPPRSRGTKLKSSLKASMSTPELRIHIPSSIPPSGLSAGQTPSTDHPQSQLGLGARPRHWASSVAASAATTTLEARSICDALIFARPRFRVASHEITPPATPHDDDAAKRASIRVGEGGLKGLVCFPRKASRDFSKDKGKGKEKEKEKEKEEEPREFQTLEQVLKQGAQLEKERQEWNAIGQGSLFNSRARSLSRSQHRNAPKNKRSVSVSDSAGPKVWGTIKIKRSVEMLAASALSQGHGPAPSVTSSKRTGGHGTQPSVSTTSHARQPSGSVASRAHSRNESWGQRVVCGSRSGSSLGDETPGQQHHHSSEGSLPKRAPVDNYPVVDIRPVPVGNANRARAPPSVGFSFGSSPSKAPKQPSPGPGDSESVIGLALSSPSGTSTPLMLPNHPFAHRAGAYPTDPTLPPPPVPETIATRHRHPPRSSGSTERARLDDIPKSAPPAPSKFEQHPFVARASTHSGEVQRMFESAMLRSAGGQGDFGFHARRGSGDSGLGSSVHELAGHLPLLSSSAPVRGSAFGPPAGLEAMLERAPVPVPTPIPESSASPPSSVQSPPSLMDSLSPTSRILTRTSSGMIDPSLMSPQSRSHESTSSFSSPRPLNSIDDIESLRDIFYRPSPDRRAGSLVYRSQDGSPASEPVLVEEEEEEEEEEERNEDWTFGRRPFELGSDAHLIWRQRQDDVDSPLRISLAPGTPSPPPLGADNRSERSVRTTTSQQVSGENVTFGVVPSARMDMLSVNVVSPRQSAALSLIDMYDYEFSSPNTPQHTQSHPSSYHTLSSPGSPTLLMDATATPLSASVLSSYFTVDTSSRRETD